MICVLLALSCFILYVLSHAVAFRAGLIRFELIRIFVLMLLWGIVYFFVANSIRLELGWKSSLFDLPLFWSSLLLYVLMSFWYFGETTVVRHPSPSMKIVAALSKNGGEISAEEIRKQFSNEELIVSRLNDLVAHGHIKYDGNSYTLLPSGDLVVRIFRRYRQLLGRNLGG